MPDEPSNGSSEIAALAQQVETARGKLPLQLDPALLEVLSEREIAAERELAEWIRAQRRTQRRREIEAELAAEQRDRKSAAALRRSEEADARWHRRALAARRRASSEDARLAQLYRRAEWSSRALIAVVVLGMVWAGVNVQHNLVPSGDMSDPLYWLSYGIEAMISIPIITIMVAATTAAKWGRELARGKVIFFEAALLGTTVALNTGPHLAAGDLGRAAEYAIAPVMVGVVIWLHAWVSARYAVLIDGAPVIERDRRMIRLDAQPGTAEAEGYHSLDAAATSGRGRWEGDTYTAAVSDSRAAHHDAGSGTEVGHRGDVHGLGRPTSVHRTIVGTGSAPRDRGTSETPFTHRTTQAESANSSAATSHLDHGRLPTHGHAVDSPINGRPHTADRAFLAAASRGNGEDGGVSNSTNNRSTNGHAVESLINGHSIDVDRTPLAPVDNQDGEAPAPSPASDRTDARPTNGHAAETPISGHAVEPGAAFHRAPYGRPVESITNGHARDLSTNGHALPPIENNINQLPVNGNAHPRINGHTVRPATNGHTVADAAQPLQVDGNIVRPSTNGHITASPTNGDAHTNGDAQAASGHAAETPADIAAQALPLGKHTARAAEDHPIAPNGYRGQSVVSSEVTTPSPHAVPPGTQHVPEALVDGHPTRSAESETAQISPATFEEGVSNRAEAPEFESPQPRFESTRSAAQQISLADLHDGLEFVEHSRTRADGAASTHAAVNRGERSIDRAHRGDDTARRPGPIEPMPTPTSADTAAQVHPNAIAPRAAKRGKSASAEQNDRSADAESEQLALEETPELSHPRVEPMPILEDDDEDDEFPAEKEEADTDDDEISALARAITDRRLSDLPIEEVREILTLADQGGTTPAIANELGVPRSAVTRVLDSAFKVHRPYASIG
ncbi:hypothetical protein IU427_06985 [Nocardia beijingensis]|uniref:hypothetical protein n=1 Tax=Nocardia beijingensis TaxID=95162 RepID=UPI00189420B4|nr:hypothetical protein [Nocardia beijingensis]MBF6464929.1 hypothetical protein [Nocardia beijingensis]